MSSQAVPGRRPLWPARPAGTRLVDRAWGRAGLRCLTLAVLLGAWQVAGTAGGVGLPSPARTASALAELLADPAFHRALWATNQALVLGFGLAVAVALPLGLLMGRLDLVNRTVRPYLSLLIAVPVIAFIPVIQATLGLTLSARVAVVFLFSVAYVAVNCAVGVRSTDPALVEMARSFGAGRLATIREVILPAAVPGLMAGVRVGLGQALIGMVVAELALVGAGVGSLIAEFQGRFQVASVMAVTLVVVAEGVLLLSLAAWCERRLSRWKGGTA
ncbi:ABC transporter permease [Micromonospora fluostatini]|uniref:ABC transporter permease n=1 Tax=Micromonospora sp. JCM 30529 TaxID=3421643 RepID=UPI003D17799D